MSLREPQYPCTWHFSRQPIRVYIIRIRLYLEAHAHAFCPKKYLVPGTVHLSLNASCLHYHHALACTSTLPLYVKKNIHVVTIPQHFKNQHYPQRQPCHRCDLVLFKTAARPTRGPTTEPMRVPAEPQHLLRPPIAAARILCHIVSHAAEAIRRECSIASPKFEDLKKSS